MLAEAGQTLDGARLALLRALGDEGYQFRTPAPSTHWRVRIGRGLTLGHALEDVFGWNLPFAPGGALKQWAGLIEAAGALKRSKLGLARSSLRVATAGNRLYLHSEFPTPRKTGVFFGPDSYRFADFIVANVGPSPPNAAILDLGAGSGIGGVSAADVWPGATLTLSDVNPSALALARVNAAAAGLAPTLQLAAGVPKHRPAYDLIVANPPYIGAGPRGTYSDGGQDGVELTLAWTMQALRALKPAGRFLLYGGSPFHRQAGDRLRSELAALADAGGCSFSYQELDPDVFPSTLLHRPYWNVERIAAIGAVFVRYAQ